MNDSWISVDERLPEEQNREYLVWCESNKCYYTAMLNDRNEWRYFGGNYTQVEEPVTHWHELPERPNLKE